MTLTDFLLARIAEDQEAAPFVFAEQYTPARVLAECEAKRRIVATFSEFVGAGRDARLHETAILKALALPYADHPDYREEWRA